MVLTLWLVTQVNINNFLMPVLKQCKQPVLLWQYTQLNQYILLFKSMPFLFLLPPAVRVAGTLGLILSYIFNDVDT